MLHKCIAYTILLLLCTSAINAQNIYTCFGNGTVGSSGDGGAASAAQLSTPASIAADADGNIYVADAGTGGYRVRKIDLRGNIYTHAGTGISGYSGDGGPATNAQFNSPASLAFDNLGNLYIADASDHRIRKINTTGIITTIAGTGVLGFSGDTGPATNAQLNAPIVVYWDRRTSNLLVCDALNNLVRKIDHTGIITTIAGTSASGYSGDGGPATAATLNYPAGLTTDTIGNIYIAEFFNHIIRKIDTNGIISTFAGTGSAGFSGDGGAPSLALVNKPCYISVDSSNNLYFSDQGNSRIRKITASGIITTIAGSGVRGYGGDTGPATSAMLNSAAGIYIANNCSNNILIADQTNHRVRVITNNYNAPVFSAGHSQSLDVCRDSATAINSLLNVTEPDANQELTWSVLQAPANGAVSAYYSALSTGGTMTPTGLTYTPTTGYVGTDSFKIQLYDCTYMHDSTTVYVTIAPCALSTFNRLSTINALTIVPNPSNGSFTLTLPNTGNETNTVTISNTTGEKVYEFSTTDNTVSLKLNLPNGLYFITARSASHIENAKIVISE